MFATTDTWVQTAYAIVIYPLFLICKENGGGLGEEDRDTELGRGWREQRKEENDSIC